FDRALSQEPGHVQVKVNTLMSAGNGEGMLDDDALPLEMPPTTLPNEPVDPLDVTPDLDTPELPSLSTPTSPTLPALDPPVVEDTVTPTIDDIPTSDLPPLEQALTPDDELPLEEDLRLENPTEGTTPGDINDLLNLEN